MTGYARILVRCTKQVITKNVSLQDRQHQYNLSVSHIYTGNTYNLHKFDICTGICQRPQMEDVCRHPINSIKAEKQILLYTIYNICKLLIAVQVSKQINSNRIPDKENCSTKVYWNSGNHAVTDSALALSFATTVCIFQC